MPVTLSTADQRRYDRMVRLLHSLVYALTTRFLQDETSRKVILKQLGECARELLQLAGCGDLCVHKEKGCVSCDYMMSVGQTVVSKKLKRRNP